MGFFDGFSNYFANENFLWIIIILFCFFSDGFGFSDLLDDWWWILIPVFILFFSDGFPNLKQI